MSSLPFVKLIRWIVIGLFGVLPPIIGEEEVVAIKPIDFAVYVDGGDVKIF